MSNSLQQDAILLDILQTAVQAVNAQEGSICLVFDSALIFSATTANQPEKLLGTAIPAGSGIMGLCFQFQQPTIVNDVKADPNHNPMVDSQTGDITRQQMVIPLSTPLNEWGCLTAINAQSGDGFSANDLQTYLDASDRLCKHLDAHYALEGMTLRRKADHA